MAYLGMYLTFPITTLTGKVLQSVLLKMEHQVKSTLYTWNQDSSHEAQGWFILEERKFC